MQSDLGGETDLDYVRDMDGNRKTRRDLFTRAVGIWGLLAGFAVVNGLFGRNVLEPHLGADVAHVLATTTLAGAVFLAALLWIGWGRGGESRTDLLAIGALWVALTAVLELGLGLARGLAPDGLFADYDVTRGRLFGLVLLAELVSPPIAGFLRHLGR
jgi:hypothetical protein